MITTKLSVITVALLSSFLVTRGDQNNWKWQKPYAFESRPPKYLHSEVHNQPKPYSPIAETSPSAPFKPDRCELRKVVFTQDSRSPQYIAYKTKIPDMKEFTLCHWHNIFNYTHDQPIFSYTLPGKPRIIYSWIENSPQKTYYSMAINGHTIYRLNYPEKLFKWYHVCQSWNGHTGEWQLWVNAERVGRGFYNLMAGKLIKGGGVAISGREFVEQALAIDGPAYSGELTLVTLYKAALTAGKAYNDHKHHHVHNFHHGYDESVDEAETEEPPAAPAAPEPTRPPHLAHGGPFANGQLLPKLPVHTPAPEPSRDEQLLFDGGLYDFYAPLQPSTALQLAAGADDTFRVNLLDRQASNDRYKRNATKERIDGDGHRAVRTNSWTPLVVDSQGAVRAKRWTPLVVTGHRYGRSGFDRKREPAEWEVVKVAGVCTACEPDPFGEASVLSWQNTRKQFYNGALYLPALPKCYLF